MRTCLSFQYRQHLRCFANRINSFIQTKFDLFLVTDIHCWTLLSSASVFWGRLFYKSSQKLKCQRVINAPQGFLLTAMIFAYSAVCVLLQPSCISKHMSRGVRVSIYSLSSRSVTLNLFYFFIHFRTMKWPQGIQAVYLLLVCSGHN